jgi:hypothetical protein
MSTLTTSQRWDALGIYNSHMFVQAGRAANLGLPDVYISYQSATTGMASQSARWYVLRPGRLTDPKGGSTFNPGQKAFWVHNLAERAEALEQAKAWSSERYGLPVDQWGKIPGMGMDVFPSPLVTWAKGILRAAPKMG